MCFLRNGSRPSVLVQLLRKSRLISSSIWCLWLTPSRRQVVGALGGAQIADWIGRKYTLMGAIAVSFVAITLEFIATTNPMFFGGKFLNGFAVGTIQTVAYTYIGEVRSHTISRLLRCIIDAVQ